MTRKSLLLALLLSVAVMLTACDDMIVDHAREDTQETDDAPTLSEPLIPDESEVVLPETQEPSPPALVVEVDEEKSDPKPVEPETKDLGFLEAVAAWTQHTRQQYFEGGDDTEAELPQQAPAPGEPETEIPANEEPSADEEPSSSGELPASEELPADEEAKGDGENGSGWTELFEAVTVTGHVDGDTVVVTDAAGAEHRLRFIGVDTPETVHPTRGEEPYGREASDFTKSKLYGRMIYLEKDVSNTDRYGRLLRYLWLEIPTDFSDSEIRDHMFNAHLLLEGYAAMATFPPDVKYVDFFRQYENEARDANRGFWGATEAETSLDEAVLEGYIGSARSDKYHEIDCQHAQTIAAHNLVTFETVEQARLAGYVSCGGCKPD